MTDTVQALKNARDQLYAIAGLLQCYPRPSNDPNGRLLLDATELAKAAYQAAKAAVPEQALRILPAEPVRRKL